MRFNKHYLFILFFLSTIYLEAVEISGTIYFERIKVKNIGGSSFLDESNIIKERAKYVSVVAIDSSDNLIQSTFTDDNGTYKFSNLPNNTDIKIRVYAKMKKLNRWSVKVVNNTNNDSLYGIEGSSSNSGNSNSIRDITATVSSKNSPPFAILDSIYLAMHKVVSVDSKVTFPQLTVSWSTNNITTGTYYDGEDNIMLQGDQHGDSDEYDDHIIIHEWGHYFERNFSRADNIGGQHGTDEHLDIRVAFGEGFGNAFSAMVTNDPIYFDTMENSGWNMNIETAQHDTPGWFSESSIQRILYDLYDSHDDEQDRLSLGFKPIYETLVNGQRYTPAFTTIFSFITELKKVNPTSTDKIDNIVANEDIGTIEDIYGSNRISNLKESSLPLYKELTVDKTIGDICTINYYGTYNKLSNHKYIRFSINENGTYPIEVKQSNGRSSDPEFILFKSSPFEKLSTNESGERGVEKASLALTSGDYLLDIYDSNNIDKACFSVSVGEVTKVEESNNSNVTNNSSTSTGSTNNENGRISTIGLTLPENVFLSTLILFMILFVPLFFMKKELELA